MRNKQFTLLFLLLVSAMGARGQDTGPVVMNLDQCLEYALDHHANVLNAEIETNISKATIRETRADGLPQVNGSISYTNNPAIQVQPIPDFITPAVYNVLEEEGLANRPDGGFNGVFPASFGTTHSGGAGITATQMIFDGTYFVALNAAKTYKELAEKDLKLAKITLAENVTKAYYSVLINTEVLELVKRNFSRIDTLLRETKIMYENGFAEKIDVQRIQVNYNNVKTQINNSTRNLDMSYQMLKLNMGMPLDQPLNLTEKISDLTFDRQLETEISEFEYGDRVEYSKLNTNMLLNQLDLKRTTAEYLPSLDLTGRYGYVMGTNESSDILNFSGDNATWFKYASIGLTLEIPIFDGLRKSYTIQKSRLTQQQLQNQKKNLENSIDFEIEQTYSNLLNNIEILNSERENMELAEEVYNDTKIKYQEGVGSNLEVVEADNAFKEAQTNYFTALYDAFLSKVDYEKAMGILIEQ